MSGERETIRSKEAELRQKKPDNPQNDLLLSELHKVETRLQEWLAKSKDHAQQFRKDPIAALRAAGVDLEDDTIMELEMIASSIARKLR